MNAVLFQPAADAQAVRCLSPSWHALYGSWPITRTFPRGRSLFFCAPRMGARRNHRHGGPCHAGATMDHATPINPRDSCRVAIRIAGSHAQVRGPCPMPNVRCAAPRFWSSVHATRETHGAYATIRERTINSGTARRVIVRGPCHTAIRSAHTTTIVTVRYTPWRSTAPSRASRCVPHATPANRATPCHCLSPCGLSLSFVAPSAPHLTARSSRPAGIGPFLVPSWPAGVGVPRVPWCQPAAGGLPLSLGSAKHLS